MGRVELTSSTPPAAHGPIPMDLVVRQMCALQDATQKTVSLLVEIRGLMGELVSLVKDSLVKGEELKTIGSDLKGIGADLHAAAATLESATREHART